MWALETWEHTTQTGAIERPFGDTPTGRLVYTADGFMSALMTASERPPWTSERILAAGDDERAGACATCFAYCGRWELATDFPGVRHQVTVSLFPSWVGTVQERVARLDGDVLTLGPRHRAHIRLTWRRVSERPRS